MLFRSIFSAITDVVIYDPNNDDTRPDWGDVITDVVFFTGSFITGDFDRSEYFNGGSTIDFNSTLWNGSEPNFWYRFGNGASDNTNAPFALFNGDTIDDYSGNNYDLTATFGNPTNVMNIFTWPYNTFETEIYNQSYVAHGFHTSSVGEAYVLCATSSTNNGANDYFQNAKIAEFALIQSSSITDLEDYIPLSSTPNNEKLYTFKDLTTTTSTASIWYAFDSSDSITSTVTTIQKIGRAHV